MKYVDMHCDTLSELYRKKDNGEKYSLLKNDLQLDLSRLKKSSCIAQNFAAFINLSSTNSPFEYANSLIDLFYEQVNENNNIISPVTEYKQIEENEKNGKISALLTLEEGGVVGNEPEKLHELYMRGVRMTTLTWNYDNTLSTSNTTKKETGLTPLGFEFLKIAQTDGIIIDVSHLSDAGFWDVVKNIKTPFAASHSNCRALCPHRRNLNDEMIKALGEHGGVMGINLYAPFVRKENGKICTAEQTALHAVHAVNVGGEDSVGIGSDFDGMNANNLEINNAELLFLLDSALQKHGLCSRIREKIMYKNVLRIYKEIL